MADNSKHKRSFWSFIGKSIHEGWTESREKFGLVVDIFLLLSAFGIVVFTWYAKNHPKFSEEKWEASMNYWFALIPAGLWLIWFFFHVSKAQYKIYSDHFDKKEAELKHIQEANISALAERNQKISDLEGKLAENSEADKLVIGKQFAKEILGGKLLALEGRLHEARKIPQYSFKDDVKTQAWEVTQGIIDKTDSALQKYLTMAEYALFTTTRPSLVQEITDDLHFGESRMNWQWHINVITARTNELRKIIERLG